MYSTRFSENLNNMISNFEVGSLMVKNCGMETIVLFLAHELSHQIHAVYGFTAPLLSTASIHECNSDIAARCIAQRLGYNKGMLEYEYKFFHQDDYSGVAVIGETDLIGLGDSHKIGRTQLGYIIKGFESCKITIDWEKFFAVSLAVLRGRDRVKNSLYIKRIVARYVYCSLTDLVSQEGLLHFIESFEQFYDTGVSSSGQQLVDTDTVEKMIQIAQEIMLSSPIH